ncbi:MAG: sulfatase-like hydrolase/transferase [Clostridia bacterium]
MSKRKNVIFILSDQQRRDTVSSYGLNDVCKTPNIDALAEDGMKFTNAFTPSAICSPARASLLTGLYPTNHGVIDNHEDLKEGVEFLGDLMSSAGYYCGYAGKWHVSNTKTPLDCGFQDCKPFMGYAFPGSGVFENLKFPAYPSPKFPNHYKDYLDENGFSDVDVSGAFIGNNPAMQRQEMYARHDGEVESCIEYFVAQETCRLLEESKKHDKPFFLWSNFWGPHSPSVVPEPYYSMYNPKDIKEHPSYKETFENKPYGHYLNAKMWGLDDFGWDGMAEIAARYYGHCTLLDDMVGMIVNKLKEMGEFENTIIVYTCDHGDCLGAHRLMEKGAFTYDEIYRIPMVVHGAGNIDNDSLVYLHELMPTALEIAGVQTSQKLDGESLYPLIMDGNKSNNREDIYCQFNNHFYVTTQRMVRDNDYQFTFNQNEIGELYDFKKDPYQLNNVCYDPEYADIKKKYVEKMSNHMKELKDPANVWFNRIKDFY